MNRHTIIQKLIDKINARSYLEIGLNKGQGFNKLRCNKKISVDPACDIYSHAEPTHKMTSDDFFANQQDIFDVIFIDGLHESKQVEKDINNSLLCLSDKGFIVCHDMNPLTKEAQAVPRSQKFWNGDCWKAWVKIRSTNPYLKMYVVDSDHGCGIIQNGAQELLDLQGLELTYDNLDNNREKWLNLVTIEDFHRRM